MDIHKPKAAHSFREFLIEIGTIICGIVIALLLEQGVEAIHRAQEVREAREALNAEVRGDAERLKLIVEESDCLERQLDGYASWAQGGVKPPPYRSFRPLLQIGAWETVKSGAVTHMPLNDRIALAAFYDQVANVLKYRDREAAGLAQIDSFDGLKVLNDAQRVDLLKSESQARRAVHTTSGVASRLIELADTIVDEHATVTLSPVIRSGVDWACGRKAPDPYASRR